MEQVLNFCYHIYNTVDCNQKFDFEFVNHIKKYIKENKKDISLSKKNIDKYVDLYIGHTLCFGIQVRKLKF